MTPLLLRVAVQSGTRGKTRKNKGAMCGITPVPQLAALPATGGLFYQPHMRFSIKKAFPSGPAIHEGWVVKTCPMFPNALEGQQRVGQKMLAVGRVQKIIRQSFPGQCFRRGVGGRGK